MRCSRDRRGGCRQHPLGLPPALAGARQPPAEPLAPAAHPQPSGEGCGAGCTGSLPLWVRQEEWYLHR